MGYIQAHPERYNFNIIYSTPSIYIEAVRAANTNWTLKTDDLFPYADRAHSYWTGYFTSRPAFKVCVCVFNPLDTISGRYFAWPGFEFSRPVFA